jgi:hypothetical protein
MHQLAHLKLTYLPDDEWLGEVIAEANSRGFSGRGRAWFSKEQLQEFIDALGAFPISAENPPALEGGYWKDDRLQTRFVSVIISPTGPRGTLVATVELTGDERSGSSLRHVATLEFPTDYAELDDFRAELRNALSGGSAKLSERH